MCSSDLNWGHGLVGQLIVEPRDAQYQDPATGKPTDGSGTYTDIVTQNALIPGLVDSSYREFALWTINENPVTDSTLNLRAEPWNDRLGGPGSKDPSLLFSSYAHGDPYTPLPRAYAGDPFVIRTINVGPSVDTLHVDGHSLFLENRYTNPVTGDTESTPLNTIHYGISERFTLALDGGAGGPDHVPGDYMYYDGIGRRFRQGAWGLIRVLPHQVGDLKVLPGTTVPADGAPLPSETGGRPPDATGPGDPCPATADPVNVDVSAVDVPDHPDGHALAFVPSDQADAVMSGAKDPEPLVIHVAAGQCLNVHFTNRLQSGRASFHLDELQRAIESSGVDAGYNPEQTVAPGDSRDYRFYPPTAKIATALISDYGYAGLGGGVRTDTGPDGLYGAVEVAPVGATFFDPTSGDPTRFGSQVDVHLTDGSGYRDLTVALSDQDPQIGASFMPYPTQVDGPALVNYKSAPLADDTGNAFATTPPTPLLRVREGDTVRVHALVAPGSEQMHVFNLGGLSWPLDPSIDHGNVLTSLGIGPTETLDARITPGAAPGDYFYGDMRRPFTDAGMWGILRVLPAADCGQIKALPGAACAPPPAVTPPLPLPNSASVDPAPKSRLRGLVLPKTVNLTTLPATGVAVRLVGPTQTRSIRLQLVHKVGKKTKVVAQVRLRVPAPGKRAKGKQSISLSARWKPLKRTAAHLAVGKYTVRVQAGPTAAKLWPDTLQGRTKLVRTKVAHHHAKARAHAKAKAGRR